MGALVPFFRQKAERYSASAKVAVLASGRNANPPPSNHVAKVPGESQCMSLQLHTYTPRIHPLTYSCVWDSKSDFFFPLKWTQKECETDRKLQPQTIRWKINM